jgi:hypothetical protein
MKEELIRFLYPLLRFFPLRQLLPFPQILLIFTAARSQLLGLVEGVDLFIDLLHLLALLLLFQFLQLQPVLPLLLHLLQLRLLRLPLLHRQSHDIVVKIKGPLLLPLRQLVHD